MDLDNNLIKLVNAVLLASLKLSIVMGLEPVIRQDIHISFSPLLMLYMALNHKKL